MNVQHRNDVSIYCLSAGATIPEWLGDSARRNLSKKDESVRRRIELLQDFQMPASSQKLVQSRDARYIMAAGSYPPRLRCYDTHELTMKFERYTESHVIDMVMLGDDYGKFATMREDRTLGFHAPYGRHETVRIPAVGRAMAYETTTCDLLVAAAQGQQIFRLNLQEGRFEQPWTYTAAHKTKDTSGGALCLMVNPAYAATAVGCSDGMLRLWDQRESDHYSVRPCLSLDVQSATQGMGYAGDHIHGAGGSTAALHELTAIAFDPTGLNMAVGTAGGVVALYDVRTSRPMYIQEHKHGLPIHTLRFHSGSGMVLSADDKIIKAWRYKSTSPNMTPTLSKDGGDTSDMPVPNDDNNKHALGSVLVNVESSGKLAHFIVAGDATDTHGQQSGVLLCATDQPKMESYYIPALGVAPAWCSFLESITEELEERDLVRGNAHSINPEDDDPLGTGEQTIYENYKFVTRDELETLGITHLVGTPLLRGYMHGYFMDLKLYNRVKAVANPFEYEAYQKKKLQAKLAEKRASRIAPKGSQQKQSKSQKAVNPEFAERLESKASSARSKKAGTAARNILSDDRFGMLFSNPDFEIDKDDENFKLRNPSGVTTSTSRRKKENMDSDDEEEEDKDEYDDEEDVGSRDDESNLLIRTAQDEDEEDDEDDHSLESNSDDDDGFAGARVRGENYDELKALEKTSKKSVKTTAKPQQKRNAPKRLPTLVDNAVADAADGSNNVNRKDVPLSKRLDQLDKDNRMLGSDVRPLGGNKELTYVPRETKRKLDSSGDEKRGRRSRRGIKELKLGRGGK